MPPKLLFCLLAFAIAATQSLLIRAEPLVQKPPIRVGFIEFPPYSYTDAQGQPVGDLLEFFRVVAQQAGYETTFYEYPSYRLFKAMETGQIEMSPSLISHPVMGEYTVPSRYLVARVKLNLYFNDQPPPSPPENLRDTRLLLIKGLVYLGSPLPDLAKEPANGITLVMAPTHRSAVRMMYLRRADYLLDYQDPAEAAFQEIGMPVLPHLTLLRQDFTIAYSLQSPRAQKLRDELDLAIEELQRRGELPGRYADIYPHESETVDSP